jgi:hypothetical protein
MLVTAHANAGDVPIEVVIYVDDDPETEDYLLRDWPVVKRISGSKRLLSAYWNDCAAAATGDILMLANDDIVFHSEGWAVEVEKAFAESTDKILVVHADNGQPNAAEFCTHPFVHRRWYETVGYFVPPQFAGDYTDTWIWAVGAALKRLHYLPDVKIEHLHYLYQKSDYDETYASRVKMEQQSRYAQLFHELTARRMEDVEKLRKVMS